MGKVVISVCIDPEVYEAVAKLRQHGFNVSAVCNDALREAVGIYAPDPRLDEATQKAVEAAVEVSRKLKEEEEARRKKEEAQKAVWIEQFGKLLKDGRDFLKEKIKHSRQGFLNFWTEKTGMTEEQILELLKQAGIEAE